jgi:hypothetical protein
MPKEKMTAPEWLAVDVAAQRMGVGQNDVVKMALRGEIRRKRRRLTHMQTTPRWAYFSEDVERIRKERGYTGFRYHKDTSGKYVNVKDAARMLQQSERTIRSHIVKGDLDALPGVKFQFPRPHKALGVKWADVMAMVVAQRASPHVTAYESEVVVKQLATVTVVPTFGPLTRQEEVDHLKDFLNTTLKTDLHDPDFCETIERMIRNAVTGQHPPD